MLETNNDDMNYNNNKMTFNLFSDFFLHQCISTHKLKIDYPCSIKLWLVYFFNIVFPFMQINFAKMLNIFLNFKTFCDGRIIPFWTIFSIQMFLAFRIINHMVSKSLKWVALSFKLSVLKKTHIWTPFNV